MAKNNEIFSPEEIVILEQKKTSKEITPEEYKKLLELKKADISLEGLKNDSNKTIEQKVNDKIKKIREYKEELTISNVKDKAEQAVDDVKKKAGDKVNEVKKEVTKKIIEKTGLGKIMEKFTGMFDKISGVFDKLWKKILGAIGGALGINLLGDDKKAQEEKTVENKEDTSKEKIQKKLEKEGKIENKNGLDKNKENDEKNEKLVKNGYKHLGRKFLEKVSPSRILYNNSSNDYNGFMNQIEDSKLTYSEIKEIRDNFTKNSGEEGITGKTLKKLGIKNLEIKPKELLGMLNIIAGSNSIFIIENNLEDIKSIIENSKFQKRFGNKYDGLKEKSYGELKIEEIEILLGYTMPIAVLSEFTSILPNKEDYKEYKETIESEIENRKTGFFSKEFLKIIGDGFNEPGLLKSNNLENKFNDKIKNLKQDKKDILLKDFEDFSRFSNSVLSQLENKKFSLNLDGFEENFQNKVTPFQIFNLYLLFDGHTNFRELSGTNKMLMYLWVAKIPKDNKYRNKYLQELFLKSNSNNNTYLNDEEKLFITPLLESAGYKVILEEAIKISHSIKTSTQTGIIDILKTNGIDVEQSNYDMIDYIILGSIFGLTYTSTKLPLPLHMKIIIAAGMSSFGTTYLIGILKEHGVFYKMLKDITLPEEIRNSLKNLEK